MSTTAASSEGIAERIAVPDQGWLRDLLEQVERIERPSASDGEREAAEWLRERFEAEGAQARLELERAHGTFWWPLGLGAVAGALGGLAALRGRRLLGLALGAAGAAAIADEFPPNRRRLRGMLPQRETSNVVCELGPADAEQTVVLVAHHDAAHSGLVFHPGLPLLADRLGLVDRTDTSPMLMAPVIGGPIAAAIAAATGNRMLARLATILGTGSALAMADIGSRRVVPGANDNGTGVVLLLAIARRLLESPTASTRVVLLSAGSEESFSEGIKAFGERHFPDLPRQSTFFLCVDTVGSPHLTVLRGEGFLKMWEYPRPALDLIDGLAQELGIHLVPNLRLHNGTDGLEPLAAGYPTVALCSCTDLKQPANYHWPTDTTENVDFETLAGAVRLSEAVIRSLDERWPWPS